MKWLLSFVGGMVAYSFLKMLAEYSKRKQREEAWRMMAEGRNEEAKEMRHRNSTMKMNDTPDWDTIDWAEVDDSKDLLKIVLSRVIEKLCVVWIQEPAVFVGVEEEVQWIQRELMHARLKYSYVPEQLMDVVYDFEDVIDDLILRSAAKQRRIGNWERCLLLIRIHMKLELIKSKIPALPHLPRCIQLESADPSNYSIEEIVWSDIFLIHGQSVANTVVSPVEEKVSALVAQEAINPYTKKKAMRVLDKLRSLNGFLKGLESVELDDGGMVWMEELSHVCLSAVVAIEDFINRTQQLTKRSWMGPSNGFLSAFGKFKSQDKLAVEMDKIYAKIQNLSIHRPTAVNPQGQSRNPKSTLGSTARIPRQPTTQEPDLASFGDDVHAMIARLLTDDQNFRVIPIMGMQGIGKTTLANLIFNHKAVVDHFPFAAWRSDGYRFQVRNKGELLQSGRSQCRVWSNQYEMQRLIPFLINDRSLIVLDDSHLLYDMLEVLPDTLNGSRMILTTCETRLPPNLKMKSDPHQLRLRTDEESWALFTHALKFSIPPELLKLKDEIAKRCGGLPLLIVKLGEALSHKDATIEEWSTALQQFHHDQQQLWPNTIYKIHKDLSLYMRRCLFYFTLFPQDFDIPARRLITLWVAEDLVQPEGENETPEDVAERCLHFLIAQGMVQVTKKKLNGNVKMVRLPDALRQYWSSKAQQATFLGVHTNTRSELSLGTNKIRRLVDHLDKEDISFDHIHGNHNRTSSTSLTPCYKDALSFLSFDTRKESKPGEEVGNFLHQSISSGGFLVLLVLDLENVFRPKLPEAIGKLTRLRYLGLRSTFLEILPSSISKLQNVQTLDLKHTCINALPHSIWKLQQLRHLHLSESCRSKLMLQHDTNIPTILQTLCGLLVDEETPVRDGLDRLLDIRKLGLTVSSKQEAITLQLQAVVDWVLKLNQLRSLRLKSIDESNQPWDLELKPLVSLVNLSYIYLLGRLRNPSIMSQFPYSLIDLTLSGSGLVEDPMQSLDKLPNLRSLKLLAKSYLGKNMLCSLGGFPQLRVLKLWKLEQLEEWNVEKGALQALRDLEIRFCRSLKILPAELLHRTLLKIEIISAQV
ncbi:probable disease resistance RPP8-like protein 2 [Vitis riparia]|uniref:probable disease resistance RPP8-like protein 2 n=1 Tax=Vitis riparia TaxID=96939 RepID=UPI00155B306D|nr:probable disease resistance RPP8-like protein 2 [Vitis riparia]